MTSNICYIDLPSDYSPTLSLNFDLSIDDEIDNLWNSTFHHCTLDRLVELTLDSIFAIIFSKLYTKKNIEEDAKEDIKEFNDDFLDNSNKLSDKSNISNGAQNRHLSFQELFLYAPMHSILKTNSRNDANIHNDSKLENSLLDSFDLYPEVLDIDLSIRITNDLEMQGLNKLYRNKDYATNILSFPYEPHQSFLCEPIHGDIVVSLERVIHEARNEDYSIFRYFASLLLHSILHLMGYDHEHDQDAEIMESIEERVVALLPEFTL